MTKKNLFQPGDRVIVCGTVWIDAGAGIVKSFNADRKRYLVKMIDTGARCLVPENLLSITGLTES